MIINLFYYTILLLILLSLYIIYIQKFNINNTECGCVDSNIAYMNKLEMPLFIFTGLLFLLPPGFIYYNNVMITLIYILILLTYYIVYITYVISLQRHNIKLLSNIIKKCDCIEKEYYNKIFNTGLIVQLTQGIILSIILLLSFNIRKNKHLNN
jgi:hypothetical protein